MRVIDNGYEQVIVPRAGLPQWLRDVELDADTRAYFQPIADGDFVAVTLENSHVYMTLFAKAHWKSLRNDVFSTELISSMDEDELSLLGGRMANAQERLWARAAAVIWK